MRMFAAEVVPTLMMPRRNEITSGVVKVDLVSMPVMTATQGRKREEVISEGAPSRGASGNMLQPTASKEAFLTSKIIIRFPH